MSFLVPSFTRVARRRALGFLGILTSLMAAAGWLDAACADDPAPNFSPTFNLAGARWNYGWTPTRGGAFTLFTNHGTDGFGIQFWNNAANQTKVSYNPGASVAVGDNTTIPSETLSLFPGNGGQYAVVRWTAPAAATYTVIARFVRRSTNGFQSAEVGVLLGAAVLYDQWITNDVSSAVSVTTTVAVAAGDHVDFVVGDGDGGNISDTIGLDATINAEPEYNPAGPVIPFAGQRFVACQGDSAFESVAFDPVNRRIASMELIRNICGAPLYQGITSTPGIAWDIATNSYWTVTNARLVQRWTPTGQLIGTVFTVPLTFTVPGWGLDTLESVKGIAVDSNFVYFVDAGDGGTQGQIRSNEWFKFTRAGAPVKSSKTTNFHANLDLNPDAIVDDIVYVPFTAPYLKGKLMIPLEHSGFQVIDTDGNFVSKFRWTDPALPPGIKIAAFTGLTIDPLTGSLYLVNNDGGGSTQIWARLPFAGATSYVVGTGTQPRLHYPNPGCNRPLWESFSPDPGLAFGIAYRAADRSVYCSDFSSNLWRFAPGSGLGARVRTTGVNSVWGLAFDSDRAVFYGGMEQLSNIRIVAMNPNTGSVTPLPNKVGAYTTDLAFNPSDHQIYGVASVGGGPKLMRIDRDTGIGTVVGPTTAVNGLDWDPATAHLIGISNASGLWSIDHTTGASTLITSLPNLTAWEGLAVIPVPAASLVAVDPERASDSAALRVIPNSARGATDIELSLPAEAAVEAAVYDVSGRRLKSIASGRLRAGTHRLTWDGRDADGHDAPSGVYFVRVDRGAQTEVARIVRVE